MKVSLGMFVYNNECHIEEAIQSLLNQTYSDFELVIVDDGSTDSTPTIIQNFLKQDNRIRFFENKERKGLAGNCLEVFRLTAPHSSYFAWVGGHDRHHPRWLESLVHVLDQNENVILSYPFTERISEEGEPLNVKAPQFETVGLSTERRVQVVTQGGEHGFGNMIYGLFRKSALEQVGVFHHLLLPDATLLAELSVFGEYHQVKEILWYRRFGNQFSIERQRKAIFPEVPWYAYIPWPIVNSFHILKNISFSFRKRTLWQRILGFKLAYRFLKHRWLKIRWQYPRFHSFSSQLISSKKSVA